MLGWIDGHSLLVGKNFPRDGVDDAHLFDLIAEHLNANGLFFISRENFNDIASHAKRPAGELKIVASVMTVNELR